MLCEEGRLIALLIVGTLSTAGLIWGVGQLIGKDRRRFWYWYLTSLIGDFVKAHNPDNPRNWTTDDELLTSPYAPHETAAVLRVHRNGHPVGRIASMLRISPAKIQGELLRGMDQEGKAAAEGLTIYDGSVEPGTV